MKTKSLLLTVIPLISAQVGAEMPRYRATQFTLPWDVRVTDSNSRGDTLYYKMVDGVAHNFIRSMNGSVLALPLRDPAGNSVIGTALDDHGNVALAVDGTNDGSRVGLWNERDGFRMMPDAPFPISFTMVPSDITNSGLVGWSTFDLPGMNNNRGIWNINTNEVTYLPNTAGGNTQIWDVSENGHSAGIGFFSPYSAVFHPGGSSYVLNSLPGTVNPIRITRVSVSNDGIVVGNGQYITGTTSVNAAHIWNRTGSILETWIGNDIGFMGMSGDGLILGGRFTNPSRAEPFLNRLGESQVSLDSLVDERNFTGPLVGNPESINDDHSVFIAQVRSQNTDPQSFIFLEPVPEPGTVLALGAGLIALLRRRRTT